MRSNRGEAGETFRQGQAIHRAHAGASFRRFSCCSPVEVRKPVPGPSNRLPAPGALKTLLWPPRVQVLPEKERKRATKTNSLISGVIRSPDLRN
jgi:hypothetical protein